MTSLQRVCVTGAAGFIASWIVAGLLQRGYRVRGTVRNLAKGAPHLQKLDVGVEHLELVEAELSDAKSFAAAVAGSACVFHTASPYVLDARSVAAELVAPAVEGTLNVLAAAKAEPSVKRVVLTSSMAAITDEPPKDRVLTEADWNERSSPTRNPYYYSKTAAERAAWKFVADEKPGFDLVALNPFFVLGPSMSRELNTTNKIFVDLLKGVYPGILSLAWGLVDVRDVAEAHIRAMERPGASGRYILANAPATMREVVGWMREAGYGEGTKLPTAALDNAVGDALIWIASHARSRGVGGYLRTHIGRVPRYDAGKARKELGLTLRPPRQSVIDTLEDLARWRHIAAIKRPQPDLVD
jgi:dihydroflavonol-4-reductase